MAQQQRTHLVSMRMRVQSLASIRGLGIWCCHELWCGSQAQLRSGVAVAEAGSCSSDLSPSLRISICPGCCPKKTKKKKKKKKRITAALASFCTHSELLQARCALLKISHLHFESLDQGFSASVPTDVWSQIILGCQGLARTLQNLASTLLTGVNIASAHLSQPKMSPDIARYPLGLKSILDRTTALALHKKNQS